MPAGTNEERTERLDPMRMHSNGGDALELAKGMDMVAQELLRQLRRGRIRRLVRIRQRPVLLLGCGGFC